MTIFHTFLLLLAAANQPSAAAGEPFRLDDFRWVPISAHKTPLGVDCGFEVLQGAPTVHVELLPVRDFRLFAHGRDYNALATTPTGRRGEFKRVIDEAGEYACVIINAKSASPAMVTLRVATTLNPRPGDIASTLSPGRRVAVVALSLGFFLVSISWSGQRLIRAMRRNRPSV